MKFNLPLADAWRVNNKKEKEYYIKNYGISPNRIIVNNTLVNSEIFSQTISKDNSNKLRRKITDNESTKLLIWAGRAVKFKRIDKNKDGFLTLKEYIGNPEGRNVSALKKQFSRRDTNANGKLTLSELNK